MLEFFSLTSNIYLLVANASSSPISFLLSCLLLPSAFDQCFLLLPSAFDQCFRRVHSNTHIHSSSFALCVGVFSLQVFQGSSGKNLKYQLSRRSEKMALISIPIMAQISLTIALVIALNKMIAIVMIQNILGLPGESLFFLSLSLFFLFLSFSLSSLSFPHSLTHTGRDIFLPVYIESVTNCKKERRAN